MKINIILPRLKFLADPLRNAPLGPLYVAAALQREGLDVSITDDRAGLGVIPDADAYAWTATTLEYPEAVASAWQVRRLHPTAPFVLGGVHASLVPMHLIDTVFDIVARGAGERLAGQIANQIRRQMTSLPKRALDIDSLPWPARELLPRAAWVSDSLVDAGVPATTVIASRGCPYHCAFCAAPTLYGGGVRWRAVDKVAEEVRYLKEEHGIRGLRFHDDCFGINRKRLRALCDMLGALGMVYRVNMRATAMDGEAASLLLKSGCTEVGIGVESANQPSLDAVGKELRVEAAEQAIRACKTAALRVRAFLMIGLPYEGQDISDKTIAFLARTRPDRVVLSSFVPFPGSRVHERPQEYGLTYIDPDIGRHRMFVGLGEDEPFRFCYPGMSAHDLGEHRKRIQVWLRQEGMA